MTHYTTALIVDDEQDAREGLERLINVDVPEVKVIAKAFNAQSALELIVDKSPDIIFLDIQMPGNDGFWLADKLGNMQIETSIIFVTAYDEYAIEAIKHAAFDFLTKPVIPEELQSSVKRYLTNNKDYNLGNKLKNLQTYLKQQRVRFNHQSGFVFINVNEIIYCRADRNYCEVVLADGKTELLTMQLGSVEKKLDKNNFLRIDRSTLINIDYLDSFDRKTKTVVLSDVIQKHEFRVSSSGARKLRKL